MAVATRGARGGSSFRSLFSFRIFISAMFSLLFVATLSVLLTTNPSTSNDDSVSSSVFFPALFDALLCSRVKFFILIETHFQFGKFEMTHFWRFSLKHNPHGKILNCGFFVILDIAGNLHTWVQKPWCWGWNRGCGVFFKTLPHGDLRNLDEPHVIV